LKNWTNERQNRFFVRQDSRKRYYRAVHELREENQSSLQVKQSVVRSEAIFESLIRNVNRISFFLDYVLLNVEFNIFMKNDIMIIIYVNNLIFIKFHFAIIFWLKNVLHERFEINDLKLCIYYFNMMIVKNRHFKLLILNQNVYVEQILRNQEMWNCESFVIFMNVSCRLI
jgi:hypothetical protein